MLSSFSKKLALKKVRDTYNSMAGTYDNIEEEAFYANQYRVYRHHLDRHVHVLTGRVLDLGCGSGLQSVYVAEHARQVVGVDISDELLKKAGDKCGKHRNLQLVDADATSLPFRSGCFDAVISYGEALSHPVDYRQAFSEVCRVLRPEGAFIFSVLNKWNIGLLYSPQELFQAITSRGGHLRVWRCQDDHGNPTALALKTYTRREIEDLGSDLGFTILDSQCIHMTSLLVPLTLQKQNTNLWGRAFRYLGSLDCSLPHGRPWANLGYTSIYTGRRDRY